MPTADKPHPRRSRAGWMIFVAGVGKSSSLNVVVKGAVSSGLTGIACTDEQRQWNAGTRRNLEPKRLNSIDFTHYKASDQYAEKRPLPPTPVFHSQEELNRSLRHLNLPVGSLLYKWVNAEPTITSQPVASQLKFGLKGIFICGCTILMYLKIMS